MITARQIWQTAYSAVREAQGFGGSLRQGVLLGGLYELIPTGKTLKSLEVKVLINNYRVAVKMAEGALIVRNFHEVSRWYE